MDGACRVGYVEGGEELGDVAWHGEFDVESATYCSYGAVDPLWFAGMVTEVVQFADT